jgi:AraC-like DNA-binding protein
MAGKGRRVKKARWSSTEVPDALTAVVETLRLRGRLYCRMELSAPWGMAFPRTNDAHFHALEHGSCWLRTDGAAAPIALTGGDLVVLPHGGGHSLADSPETPLVPLSTIVGAEKAEGPVLLRHGGEGVKTTLICGAFQFERRDGSPLLSALPSVIHLRSSARDERSLLETSLKLLTVEAKNPQAGTQALISRLTDVVFIQALRAWVEALPEGSGGWLGALNDRQVGNALSILHQQANRRWTLASLAAAVGMSRSRFTDRFAALVGETPLAYLTRWRMHLAAGRLHPEGARVAEVAQAVGYKSETAFAKAFRRTFGVSASAYRRGAAAREQRSGPPAAVGSPDQAK